MTTVEGIRKRPGMYVGDVGEPGVLQLVIEVLANAYDQVLAGRCTAVTIEVAADGAISVADDGPGIGVPLDQLLTTPSDLPTLDAHRPHTHLGLRSGLGLFVVSALSERFEIVTVRDGREARIACARGEVVEPLAIVDCARAPSTTVRFRPDPTVFVQPRISRPALAAVLEDLAFLSPGLTIAWRIAGDDLARDGLRGRVAGIVSCATSEVAHARARHELATGPMEVEVAVGWTTRGWDAMKPPLVHSFVNFARTSEHGDHVEGLIDGACAFLGTDNRVECVEGLVGAVAIVLADVHYGKPAKNLLTTPEVRAPVAATTRAALEAWATAHPMAAAALRARAAQLASIDQLLRALDGVLRPLGFVRQARTFERVTEDGLVHVVSIGIDGNERFVRERRYAGFDIWMKIKAPEGAGFDDACLFTRIRPTEDHAWPSDAAVVPAAIARFERDGLPILARASSHAALRSMLGESEIFAGWIGKRSIAAWLGIELPAV